MSSFDDDGPMCRVTIRDGTVTLNRWRPGMGPFGPVKAGYLSVTAALADLHRAGEGELVVVPVRAVPWCEEATEAMIAWAARTGYRRLWLPDRVANVEAIAEAGCASVTCPSCGAVWEDEGPVFWERVRRDGWFPGGCLACGGSLPEWETARGAPCQTRAPRRDTEPSATTPGGRP